MLTSTNDTCYCHHFGDSGGDIQTGLDLGDSEDSGDIESELQCTSCQTWSNSCSRVLTNVIA